MLRLSFFIVTFIIIGGSETISVLTLSEYDVIHVVDNHNSCSRKDAERWADVFVNCFVNRKDLFKTRRDLFNIVARLLDRSKRCIKYATLECRPNYDGFQNIMGKVIEMIKEYSNRHVERLTNAGIIPYTERTDKIIDLDCVENGLTEDTYAACFSSVIPAYEQLGENETYDLIYQKDVEMAILCSNIAKKQCSKSVIKDLNKVVRYILGVKQPEKEEIENDRTPIEQPVYTESPKNQSELEKTGENIGANSVIFKLFISTNPPEPFDFSESEKEELESIFKSPKSSESHDFRLRKNYDDQEFHDHTKSFTEMFNFNRQTTFLDLTESGKENTKKDSKISQDLELTGTPIILEHSTIVNFPKDVEPVKSSSFLNTRKENNVSQFTEPVQPLKTTKFPKLENFPNSTDFDVSKDVDAAETGKDTVIDIFNWKVKSTASTESSKPTEHSGVSTHLNTAKKDNDLQFTESLEILKDTITSKSNDRTNPTGIDTSNDYIVADAEEDTMTEPATTDFEEEFIASTKLPKLIELPKATESTMHSKSVDISIFTTHTNPPTSTEHSKTTMPAKSPKPTEVQETATSTNPPKTTERPSATTPTKPPKPTELQETATSTNPPKTTERPSPITSPKPPKPTELQKTATSTSPPKTTERPSTTMSTKPPTPIERSRTSASTKPPKPTERSRTDRSTKPPKPIEHPRTTASTRPPKPTERRRTTTSERPSKHRERPRTTTTRRPRISSSEVRSRSRDDTPRPTESPRPWYDFIVRPFVSLWNTIKSWFGW